MTICNQIFHIDEDRFVTLIHFTGTFRRSFIFFLFVDFFALVAISYLNHLLLLLLFSTLDIIYIGSSVCDCEVASIIALKKQFFVKQLNA